MTTVMLTRRYLSEYARRPINLALLVIVPLIFVTLAAGALADFARIVGGAEDAGKLAAPSAGWAAAFLAGVAGFFHVLGSRPADRRLAAAGLGAHRIVAARLASGVLLALLAAGTALGALAVRTGIADPVRAITGTIMFAVIYLALGAGVGSLATNELNGSLIVIFVWMIDVFLGPAMGGSGIAITRVFPSHFVTLVMLGSNSGHAGPVGDIGWAVLWAIGSGVLAAGTYGVAISARSARRPHRHDPLGLRRFGAALRFSVRDYRRNTAMWVLLAALPVFFITLSFYTTPDQPAAVRLLESGVGRIATLSMTSLHGAIMVPITIAALAGLAGLFVVQGSLEADSRLALAGFKAREILAARLGVIGMAAVGVSAVSLAVTAVGFAPENWWWFTAANLMVALTYGMVGVVIGVVFGRLGGLYLMFLIPFIDIGIAQNVMFSAAPLRWGSFLPGNGAVRMLIDAAFTPTMDDGTGVVRAALWIAGLGVLTVIVFRRVADPKHA